MSQRMFTANALRALNFPYFPTRFLQPWNKQIPYLRIYSIYLSIYSMATRYKKRTEADHYMHPERLGLCKRLICLTLEEVIVGFGECITIVFPDNGWDLKDKLPSSLSHTHVPYTIHNKPPNSTRWLLKLVKSICKSLWGFTYKRDIGKTNSGTAVSHKLTPRDRDVAKAGNVMNKYSRNITQKPTAGAGQAQRKVFVKGVALRIRQETDLLVQSLCNGSHRRRHEKGPSWHCQFVRHRTASHPPVSELKFLI